MNNDNLTDRQIPPDDTNPINDHETEKCACIVCALRRELKVKGRGFTLLQVMEFASKAAKVAACGEVIQNFGNIPPEALESAAIIAEEYGYPKYAAMCRKVIEVQSVVRSYMDEVMQEIDEKTKNLTAADDATH